MQQITSWRSSNAGVGRNLWWFCDIIEQDVNSGILLRLGGSMGNKEGIEKRPMGVMELFCCIGFAFFFGWLLLCFFWLPSLFFVDTPVFEGDIIQSLVYLGVPAGYLFQHFFAKRRGFYPFNTLPFFSGVLVLLLFPVCSLLSATGVDVPLFLAAIVLFLSGFIAAFFVITWLYVISLIRISSCFRLIGAALCGGSILFAFVALLPAVAQPVFCLCCALVNAALLFFAAKRTKGLIDERAYNEADIEKSRQVWGHLLEIEPSFMAFGLVFGLAFQRLSYYGGVYLYGDLLCAILGALTVTILACMGIRLNITFIQRGLLCLSVLFCTTVQFLPSIVSLIFSGLIIAGWAAFIASNYSFIVEKSLRHKNVPLFRQAPIRLVLGSVGFYVGWLAAVGLSVWNETFSNIFSYAGIGLALLVVCVVMLFYPKEHHHEDDKSNLEKTREASAPAVVVAQDTAESELYALRCQAIGALYGLSDREVEVLGYLAKGRNASYIEKKLVISQHTVKSHIHKIYTKLDIHSQQNLMDFVELYPLDQE